MLDLRSVRGLPPRQACEASALAEGISDEAVFLLMECNEVTKTDDSRVFSIRQIQKKPSICVPLGTVGTDPRSIMKELYPRFIVTLHEWA